MTHIIGHGVDIVDLADFEALLVTGGQHFVGRCFTEHERQYAGDGPNRIFRLAARFAAKEAVLKALGTGWTDGITWKDVEIIHERSGAPSVTVSGKVATVATDRRVARFLVSLSHTRTLATASVIALADVPPTDN
jgi:holo-[acyl-carrier protein] synthase